jgi:heme exporter protein C
MRQLWWKILALLLLAYVLVGGLLIDVPRRDIINESIRNLYFHVPMWFSMIFLFFASCVYSIRYLQQGRIEDDIKSSALVNTGIFFSVLGMSTGMEWAQYTWGAAWANDPKQLCTALAMLIYFAYLVLRGGIKDEDKRAKISAVYNIFSFPLMLAFIFILPRMVDSLHPGNGGNPAFSKYDLDNNMRMVFYPAVIGWGLFGFWLATLLIRTRLLQLKQDETDF